MTTLKHDDNLLWDDIFFDVTDALQQVRLNTYVRQFLKNTPKKREDHMLNRRGVGVLEKPQNKNKQSLQKLKTAP